jgi:hypothetical protein
MKISDSIRQALEKKKFKNLKDAAKFLDISPELLRVILNKGHLPKDRTLTTIANRLGLDKSGLILAAHQEKVPADVKGFFLSPSQTHYKEGRRISPLSSEQTDYLSKILSPAEIQLIRKYRQITEEGKTQINGFVDYTYASRKNL